MKTAIYELDNEFKSILISELFLEVFNLKFEEVNLSIDFIFKCIKFKIIKENEIKLFIKVIIDNNREIYDKIIKSLSTKMNNIKLVIHKKYDRFYIVKILLNTYIDFLRNLIRKYINNNNDTLYIIDNKRNSIITISKKEISIEVKTKRNHYIFNYFIENNYFIKNEFDKFKVIKSNKQNSLFLSIEIERDLNNLTNYTFEIKNKDTFKKVSELLQVKLENYKVIEASYNEKLNINSEIELLFESYDIKSFIDKINKDKDNFIENLIINTIVNKNKIRSFIKEIEKINIKVIEFIKNGGIYLIS